MGQYVNKATVVAEINRVLNSYDPNEITSGRYALVNLRDFLDTLEVKEINLGEEKKIAKYLYEKKGYPIDLNGNIPSFEETMKDAEQYVRYKKDKFIDVACEWLYLQLNEINMEGEDMENFLKDFRNYMKGE